MASKVQCAFCGKARDHGHRVGIVGSREFPELGLVREFVAKVPGLWTVVSGGARGVDREAERWARKNGLKLEVIQAKWDELGKSAGYRRNEELVQAVDCLVAFWDGESRGTAHVIKLAQQVLGAKRVRVIERKLSPSQRQQSAKAASETAGAIARGDAISIHDQIEMTREWNATQAAWRDALGASEARDVLDDEREIERSQWDDGMHRPKYGSWQVTCTGSSRRVVVNNKPLFGSHAVFTDGIYAGHEANIVSSPSKATFVQERWLDPTERDYLDELQEEGLIANWEELSSEELDFIDNCSDPFWAPIFASCARDHKPVTPKMLNMAQHPRFA